MNPTTLQHSPRGLSTTTDFVVVANNPLFAGNRAEGLCVVSAAKTTSRRGHRVPANTRGAALLAALCFTLVLAIALSSYITACYRSLQMSNRNVSSGHSVELAETGMEEALWALHANNWAGWSTSGTTATKTLSGFAYENNITGNASLTVTNYNTASGNHTITVTGTTTLSDGTTQSRTLTSGSSQAPLFVNAIAGTTGSVTFASAGTVDSYDSSANVDVLPTSGGQTAGFSAIVSSGSTSTVSNTVQLTNAQIKGYVATLSTGPSYSTSGKIVGPTTSNGVNIDPARISTSPYQPIFDVITPSAPTPLYSGTQTIGTAGATTPTYYYYSGNYYLGTGDTLTVDGPVVIVISGYLWTNGSVATGGKINVTSNGSLTIFLRGDMRIDGGGIVNDTKLPKNVAILAQTGNTYDLEFWTTVPFHGVIYTPTATMTFANNAAYYGALVAKSVAFGATATAPVFHYDTNLRNVTFAGIDTPFAVSSVRETP